MNKKIIAVTIGDINGIGIEISKLYQKNKSKYFRKKNVYYRPWGKYVNLFCFP